MKKFLSLILALAMVAGMSVTALADGNTQTVSISKAAPTYTLRIPSDTAITWDQSGYFELGSYYISVSPDWNFNKKLVVSWNSANGTANGAFTSSTADTKIPYTLCRDPEGKNSCEHIFFNSCLEDTCTLGMVIAPESWSAAEPGEYSTAIIYSVAIC